jgi:hypothetical protein
VPHKVPITASLSSCNRVMMRTASGSSVDRPSKVSFVTCRHTYFYTGSLAVEVSAVCGGLRRGARLGRRNLAHTAAPIPVQLHMGDALGLAARTRPHGIVSSLLDSHDERQLWRAVRRALVRAKRPLTTP